MTNNGYEIPDWVVKENYPFESKWMTLDGHRIHYLDEGPRNEPVLLFVHPGPGWSFTYRYQIQHLRDEFRCVAPDLPGYGLSEAADGYGYTLLEQSRILEKFVETLDLRNIVVWANDGGGPTAILALAHNTGRVLGLVVGGTFGWSLKEYRGVSRTLRIVTGPFFRAINRYTNILSRTMGTIALGTRSLSKMERRCYTRPFKNRNSRNRPLKLFRSFIDPATEQELDRALPAFRDKSVLILFGERDAMTGQKWPQRWAQEIPHHSLHLLPGVRHFPFEDAPEVTVENFRTWWDDLALQATMGGDYVGG